MSLKIRISSPLEAGRSILDAHHLPSGVSAALEYAAGRLARRDLGVTLVAVRREYQVPAVPPAPAAAAPPPCTPRSPGFALPHAAAPLPFRAGLKSAIKGLVRTRTHPVLLLPLPERTRALDPHRSLTVSPAFSASSTASGSTQAPALEVSPLTPGSPFSSFPMTPATTLTTVSSSDAVGPAAAFGVRLVYSASLPTKHDKFVRHVLQRTERKFNLG